MQYNETTFEYIKRLATRYGQWFYWDGMRLQFGLTKNSNIKLINGSSLHGFRTHTRLMSHKVSLAGYDYMQKENIRAALRKAAKGSNDGFAPHLAQKQHDYFIRDVDMSAYTGQAAGEAELAAMAELQAAAAGNKSVAYSGVSYEPLVSRRKILFLSICLFL